MQITINGKPEDLQADTVMDILKHKDIDPHMVAVELNTQIVERDRLATTNVQDGDTVEFLFYMGGGA
ncbi:MAG: sulfur carrier protein ThiS [Nitrospira sp.]|nr:sulfur carrier protein ThiS [Nitrospira sp.]